MIGRVPLRCFALLHKAYELASALVLAQRWREWRRRAAQPPAVRRVGHDAAVLAIRRGVHARRLRLTLARLAAAAAARHTSTGLLSRAAPLRSTHVHELWARLVRRCDQRRCLRRVRELGKARARREALRRALGRLGAVAARARWQRVYGARWQRVYAVAPHAAVRAALGRAMQRWRRYWAWRWALAAARRKGNAGAVRKAFAAVHGNASEMVIGSRRRSGGARELVLVSAKRSAVEHARTRRHCREAIRRWAAGGEAVEAAAAVAAEAARLLEVRRRRALGGGVRQWLARARRVRAQRWQRRVCRIVRLSRSMYALSAAVEAHAEARGRVLTALQHRVWRDLERGVRWWRARAAAARYAAAVTSAAAALGATWRHWMVVAAMRDWQRTTARQRAAVRAAGLARGGARRRARCRRSAGAPGR